MPGEVTDSALLQRATCWLPQVCQRCLSGSLVAWMQQQLVGGEQQQAGSCSRPEEALVV
jgi:hypothetical protein